jgi:enhancer of mRNA-decapping protein 4
MQVDERHSQRDELSRWIFNFLVLPLSPLTHFAPRSLINDRNFEAAFSIVLGNSDVELLSWLCSQLRPEDVFSGSPLTMGQEVILSLAQQLGCDLHRDPSVKAVWIRDAVLALNCSDPLLLPHIQAVLSDLYAQLEHEALECEGSAQSELRLCMRVIKTQLRG